jgi:hypothetical protein
MGGNRRIVPELPLHKYEKSRVVDGGKYRVVLVPGLGGWPMPEGYYGASLSDETFALAFSTTPGNAHILVGIL